MCDREYEPEPPAYCMGFLQQDYEEVLRSLRDDASQALFSFGYTNTSLLHAAAYDGRPEIVEVLLKLGSDINARETSGRTPLHHAANHGHIDVIDILLRNGADIEARDGEGLTPLMWGKMSRSGRSDEVVEKLRNYGAKDDV